MFEQHIAKRTPDWIYELASLFDDESIRFAICLEDPVQIELHQSKEPYILLHYENEGEAIFGVPIQMYLVDRPDEFKDLYVLFECGGQWYAVRTKTTL